MQRDAAETLALRALAWLAADEALLGAFLGATGSTPGALRGRAQDPDFLGSVLDFLLTEDAWVTGCAAGLGLPPETLSAARRALPGGESVHWT